MAVLKCDDQRINLIKRYFEAIKINQYLDLIFQDKALLIAAEFLYCESELFYKVHDIYFGALL